MQQVFCWSEGVLKVNAYILHLQRFVVVVLSVLKFIEVVIVVALALVCNATPSSVRVVSRLHLVLILFI